MPLKKLVMIADRVIVKCLDAVVISLAGLLFALLNYAVFARFILNASVSWGEELPAYILAVLTFIGAAYLTRTNEHIGFDGLVRVLPMLMQKIVFAINLLIIAIFGAVSAYFGFKVAVAFWGRPLISVDIPMTLFRSAVPIGGGLITLICLIRFVALLCKQIEVKDLLPETDD